MTKWKVLSSGFLIKQLFFEKSHFLHPHAQKTNQKLSKSFTFALKKSKKIQKIHFSKNASRWLLVTPNGFLSTPRTSKHLLAAPMHPRDTSKNFEQNPFLSLKMQFSSHYALKSWKNAFLSKMQRTKFFHKLYFMTNHARGRKYRTKLQNLLIRVLIKQLIFEKSIFSSSCWKN